MQNVVSVLCYYWYVINVTTRGSEETPLERMTIDIVTSCAKYKNTHTRSAMTE